MLSTLLSAKMAADKKKDRLENKYGLLMTKDVEEEVNQMCNLGEGIAENARKEERMRVITTMIQNGCTEDVILKGGFVQEEIEKVKVEIK